MKKMIVLLVVAALALAACSGDDGGSAHVSAPLPTAPPGSTGEPGQAEYEPGDPSEPSYGGGQDLPKVNLPRSVVKPTAPVYGEGDVVIEQGLDRLIDEAIADLAQRLDVPVADITVVAARSVVWPDGSIGCPQPDMLYTQVQVDGAWVHLAFDGETYAYHTGGNRGLFLCE